MTEELKPCPFCGIKPTLHLCDEEGNLHCESYLNNTYSGISYKILHEGQNVEEANCPILTDEGGRWLYDTEQDAIDAWNKRFYKSVEVKKYYVCTHCSIPCYCFNIDGPEKCLSCKSNVDWHEITKEELMEALK